MAYMKDATGRRLDSFEVGSANFARNCEMSKLMKWAKALNNVRAGVSDAKLLVIGDSTAAGTGSSTNATVPAYKSWPGQLAALMNAQLVPAAVGLGVPKSNSGAQPSDARWAGGTGWTLAGQGLVYVGFGGKGMYWRATGVTAGALTFNDNRTLADSYDVYYRLQPGSFSTGTFSVQATGGSLVNVDATAGGGSTRIGRVTVTAGSATTANVVSILATTASKSVDIVGVEPYLSSARKVRIGNAGAAGSATSDWLRFYQDDTANAYSALASIRGYAPDLAIIDLGINDSGNAIPLATYQANMEQIIAAAQASGDVILKTPIPSGGSNSYRKPLQDEYVAWIRTLDLPVIDIYNRVVDYATYFANGFMSGDGIHGNDYSYLDEAGFILSVLQKV